MNVNLRDTGAEIGFACARVLALSSFSLIGSLIVSGSLAVAGGFPLIEAPAHRVAYMSAMRDRCFRCWMHFRSLDDWCDWEE